MEKMVGETMGYKTKLAAGCLAGGLSVGLGALLEARSPMLRVWDLSGEVDDTLKQARKRELTRYYGFFQSGFARKYFPTSFCAVPPGGKDSSCTSRQLPGNKPESRSQARQKHLRILHLSDLHLHAKRTWLIKYVTKLSQTEYDLVVLSGDNFSDSTGLAALKTALSGFKDVPRVFVWGSNDYYSGVPKNPLRYFLPMKPVKPKRKPDLPTAEFTAWLEENGWLNANNRLLSVDIALDNNTAKASEPAGTDDTTKAVVKVVISGVNDPHINRDEPPRFDSSWQEADLRIGLSHAPYMRVLNAFWAAGADLLLCGHTHGGQLCLPLLGPLVNNSDIPLAYSGGLSPWQPLAAVPVKPRVKAGLVQELPNLAAISQATLAQLLPSDHRCWLHVSRGLGTSKYTPVRLFCRPEASLLLTPIR